jgi:hemolysin III
MNETLNKLKQFYKQQRELKDRPQTSSEEVFNSITHGTGVLLGIASLVILNIAAAGVKDAKIITGLSIYGAAFVILYLMSTLYHSLSTTKARALFKVFDHSAIFILIAGTYTPIVLAIGGTWGWVLFGIVWFLTINGIVLEAVFKSKVKKISMFIYLAMGWIIIIAWNPMLDSIHFGMVKWLLAGGLFYTGGVVFYILAGIKYFHVLWHFMVLAGSVMHFFGILFYIAI